MKELIGYAVAYCILYAAAFCVSMVGLYIATKVVKAAWGV